MDPGIGTKHQEMNMIQLLIITGSGIFLFLGTLHGLLTFRDLGNPRAFTPKDAGLRTAMQQATVALHPKINLWKAWMGFNLSHSLGIVMFGGAFLYLGIFYPSLFSQSPLLQVCSIAIPATYLALSLKFWFSKPAIGSAVSMACFILATAISHA